MGICEAYNIGADKCNFSYICFSHEDITFNTKNWGRILIEDFESDSEIGLIGIAGSAYKSWVLSGWHTSQMIPTRFTAENVIHVDHGRANRYNKNSTNKNLVEVSSIDGCFMFTSIKILNHVKFDEALFKNFHCYDIDFSLQVNQQFKVVVSFNILLSHYSGGNYHIDWFNETRKLHKKWNKNLPYIIGNANNEEIANEEESAFYGITNAICRMDKNYHILLKIYFSTTYFKLIGFKNWIRTAYKAYKIVNLYRKNNYILNFIHYNIRTRLSKFI